MATLRRPATRAKHNEVSIILILLLRPKTGAKGGRGGVGWLRCGVRVLELCSARTLQKKPTAGPREAGSLCGRHFTQYNVSTVTRMGTYNL
jgi:hypothetical protein